MTSAVTPPPGFRIDVISNPAAFERLADEWDDLAESAGDLAIFHCHAWVSCAWRRHRDLRRRSMHIVTIRDGAELVLAAPFVWVADWYGTATLAWLDSMTPLYNDILVVRDSRSAALKQALLGHIRKSWRVRALKLACVRDDAEIAPLLSAEGATREWATVAPALDVTGFADWDDFLESQSAKARYNFRRHIRLMEREGPVRFREIASGPELEAAIRWIFERKRQWVLARFGQAGWISAQGAEQFFLDVALSDAKRGSSSVMALEVKEQLIAAMLVFRCGSTLFVSKFTYDPDWKRVSPGWMLVVHTVGRARESGVRSVDLMLGQDEWKGRFGGTQVGVGTYRLQNGFWPF